MAQDAHGEEARARDSTEANDPRPTAATQEGSAAALQETGPRGNKRKSDEITSGTTCTSANCEPGPVYNAAVDVARDRAPALPPAQRSGPTHTPSPKDRQRQRSLRQSLLRSSLAGSTAKTLPIMSTPSSGARGNGAEPEEAGIEQGNPSSASMQRGQTPSEMLEKKELGLAKRSRRPRFGEKWHSIRKKVLRMRELPPSKDGRLVPIDPSRGNDLLDERREGHPYINNFIKSSKYNAFNFLPRQIFAQFSKLANFYFLTISILQLIPGLSTTGTYTTIVPLLIFVSLSMAKDGYEDFRRHALDKEENTREAKVLRVPGASERVEGDLKKASVATAAASDVWQSIQWQSLRVGDIVRLRRDDPCPADMLLLDSKGANNTAYIETMALDGETNLKNKQPPTILMGKCCTPEALRKIKADVVVEDPNLDLYNFEGKVCLRDGSTPAPITNNEIMYRGSVLRNTPEAFGLVLYSGEECKIRMNATQNPRIKAPALQTFTNKVVIFMVFFVLSLALINTVAYIFWQKRVAATLWYLTQAAVGLEEIFIGYIIMFNTLIPLSLYVSLEIVKLAQIWHLKTDIDMYDQPSNTPCEPRTSTINEELGQVSYIFSDKTGTLTENVMRFRKLSVAGVACLHDVDLETFPDAALSLHERRSSTDMQLIEKSKLQSTSRPSAEGTGGNLSSPRPLRKSTTSWRSSTGLALGGSHINTSDMLRHIQLKPHSLFAQKASMMVLLMALCHTCLPEHGENQDDLNFQASSPDELALVEAARELGYVAFDRDVSSLTVKTYAEGPSARPVLHTYKILDVIEFSSKRKRMSVIVRFPDGRICVICKGADSVIIERLRMAKVADQKLADVRKRAEQRRSSGAEQVLQRRHTDGLRSSGSSFARASEDFSRITRSFSSARGLSYSEETNRRPLDRRESGLSSQRSSRSRPRASVQMCPWAACRPSASLDVDAGQNPREESMDDISSDEPVVLERCFQHINDFASEGLRTLLYGFRFLGEEEYHSWKKIYQDATASLSDRQRTIEKAGELIERDLELGGATGIEDKLQEGVPETIDRLRRANIRMWMLTGDKRETAINIGQSCRLIKDFSTLTILDHEIGGMEKTITDTIADINSDSIAHSVLVIDGQTLSVVSADDALHNLFLELATVTDSVICCRASPSQKAGLVNAIRRRVKKSVTLAIGDGANDIAMIQEAHVGIGITGKEGLQAARVSDYSIAQFRFLNKLLLVHGRWNYVRTAKYVVGTFWKEMLFYLTQAAFQRWNGYTGTSLYERWSLSVFNVLFTSLPVIFLGIFEQDLAASTLIAVPQLYNRGQGGKSFNLRIYVSWMIMAASESMIIFFVNKTLFGDAIFTVGQDLFGYGTASFTAAVILINIKLQILEQHNITVMALICIAVMVGAWFTWNIFISIVYQNNNQLLVKGGFLNRFGANPLWWLALSLAIAACVLLEILLRAVRNTFFPTDVAAFQEIEKDPQLRRRFEEEAFSELRAGWSAKKRASLAAVERDWEERRDVGWGVSPTAHQARYHGSSSEHDQSRNLDDMLAQRFGKVKREESAE